MILTSEYKVPGGKLIRVWMEVDGEVIKRIRLTGDFFIYPEDTIERLEVELRGHQITADFVKLTSNCLTMMNAELAGAKPIDFAIAIKKDINPH